MRQRATEAKVYSAANRLTVVAPLPGLEAAQIEVSLAGDLLTIETAEPRQTCRVPLPRAVDGRAAVAVYSHGVLVVGIPLADPGAPDLDELGPGLVKEPSVAPVASDVASDVVADR